METIRRVQESVKDKTICIVGLGYVGSLLAEGSTFGYDIDQGNVDLQVRFGPSSIPR
jgi:UDP-N-acetyl-D-mannosaminuronate dehydrogenase